MKIVNVNMVYIQVPNLTYGLNFTNTEFYDKLCKIIQPQV